jgi:hypothetical protein
MKNFVVVLLAIVALAATSVSADQNGLMQCLDNCPRPAVGVKSKCRDDCFRSN